MSIYDRFVLYRDYWCWLLLKHLEILNEFKGFQYTLLVLHRGTGKTVKQGTCSQMSNFGLALQATPIPKLITHVGVWQRTCLGFMKMMMTFHRVDCMYYASHLFSQL